MKPEVTIAREQLENLGFFTRIASSAPPNLRVLHLAYGVICGGGDTWEEAAECWLQFMTPDARSDEVPQKLKELLTPLKPVTLELLQEAGFCVRVVAAGKSKTITMAVPGSHHYYTGSNISNLLSHARRPNNQASRDPRWVSAFKLLDTLRKHND